MEVHLWRGSAEQQALRDQSRPSGQFAYFDKQLGHPNWEGKSVLDFGGNRGNPVVESRLRDPARTVLLHGCSEGGDQRRP